MSLPNFIGIGVQRAATTWIYECLKQHPNIFLPKKKELHYFNSDFNNGLNFYKRYFTGAENCTAIGEITPNYINNEYALGRMSTVLPDVKILLILREPISRAYSAYKLLNEQFAGRSFEEAVKSCEYLLRLSLYSNDINRLLSLYPMKQVKIYLFEEIKNTPYEVLADLFCYLNVEPKFKPKAAENVYNPIILPNIQKVFCKFGGSFLLDYIKGTRLGNGIKRTISRLQPRPNNKSINTVPIISPDFQKYLRGYFSKDIEATQKLIGRDLSAWLE